MKEVTKQSDIKIYDHYVVRNGKLYNINRNDILIGEMYCNPVTTPTNPSDIMLMRGRRGQSKDPFYAFDPTEFVVNMNYLTPVGLANYILGIGEFKNWWEEGVEKKEESEFAKLLDIFKNAVEKKK